MRSPISDGQLLVMTSGGELLDLLALTARLQSSSDASARRGADNPRWRLYANGHADALTAGSAPHSGPYIVVWVADDEGEMDGDPGRDTNGVLLLHVFAAHPGGPRRIMRAAVQKEAAVRAAMLSVVDVVN
jgi:hypothetical protein